MEVAELEQAVQSFKEANEAVNDIRAMLGKTQFEGTQENALRIARAYNLLKNLFDVNLQTQKRHETALRDLKKASNNQKSAKKKKGAQNAQANDSGSEAGPETHAS